MTVDHTRAPGAWSRAYAGMSRRKARLGEAFALFERIANDSQPGDDCIPWPFAVDGTGHAMMSGTSVGRLLLGLERGDGLVAMHLCDRPDCVNRRHLKIGTPADNSRDMVRRGRHRSGSVR